MNHIRPTVVIITSIVLLLAFGLIGMGASAQTNSSSLDRAITEQEIQIVSSETQNERLSGLQNAGSASALAPQTNWTPPLPAYRVSIAPDASHPNKELIFGELDGIYQLNYAYLQAAGLPVETLDPRTIRMFYMGEEIPIIVEGELDGSFDEGVVGDPDDDDAVLFYGRGIDSLFDDGLLPTNKYTDANIYWLTYGGVNGARMVEKDGSITGNDTEAYLHTDRTETNYWYWSAWPFEHDADHWYWEWMQAIGLNSTASRDYDFTIDHLAPGAYTGFVTVSAVGETEGLHHLRVYINNDPVPVIDDAVSWQDTDAIEWTADVPQASFVEGVNTVKVEIVTDVGKFVDKIYTNWVKIGYYDSLVAEGDVLAFSTDQPGSANYSVSDFGSDDIQVYDTSDFVDVKLINNVTIGAGPPYSVAFGDPVSGSRRYLALARDSRLTPQVLRK